MRAPRIAVIAVAGVVAMAATSLALGVKNGELSPCPSSPNCVSSQGEVDSRAIEPLAIAGSAEQSLGRLADVIGEMPRAKVIVRGNGYLRAEFTSRIFGWVDDVEAYADRGAGVIHLRSASRTGWWDLRANRRRMEELRERFVAPDE